MMQEVCGSGSREDAFLQCMLKTRHWQDAQHGHKTDLRIWSAYYQALGDLDAAITGSGWPAGLQQKFKEWVEDCLQCEQLRAECYLIWEMLWRIHKEWQQQALPALHELHAGSGPMQGQLQQQQPQPAHHMTDVHRMGGTAAELQAPQESHHGTMEQPTPFAAPFANSFPDSGDGSHQAVSSGQQLQPQAPADSQPDMQLQVASLADARAWIQGVAGQARPDAQEGVEQEGSAQVNGDFAN